VEPWLAKFDAGDSQAAWDLFADRYRRLMLATIRRLVLDHDDVMDVFSSVCQALSTNDFARLKRYSDRSARPASVATWLVTVVRNLTVDWLRQRDGRRRLTVPATLSPLQQEIYAAVCIGGHSHVEAYELIRARSGSPMPFHEFLQEVRALARTAPCPQSAPLRHPVSDPPATEMALPALDPVETAEAVRRLAEAMASQPPDVRLAVELFVVERLSAAEVARTVGWPGPKTVYNRVYRALATLRTRLERQGIGPGDL
jgi:RNA polymerase sigma factor (sigma-70 family)